MKNNLNIFLFLLGSPSKPPLWPDCSRRVAEKFANCKFALSCIKSAVWVQGKCVQTIGTSEPERSSTAETRPLSRRRTPRSRRRRRWRWCGCCRCCWSWSCNAVQFCIPTINSQNWGNGPMGPASPRGYKTKRFLYSRWFAECTEAKYDMIAQLTKSREWRKLSLRKGQLENGGGQSKEGRNCPCRGQNHWRPPDVQRVIPEIQHMDCFSEVTRKGRWIWMPKPCAIFFAIRRCHSNRLHLNFF